MRSDGAPGPLLRLLALGAVAAVVLAVVSGTFGSGPAHDVLDTCRSEVIAGQFLDVSVQARGRATVDDAMTVLRYKSAKYSIERPLHVGAALAGLLYSYRAVLVARAWQRRVSEPE